MKRAAIGAALAALVLVYQNCSLQSHHSGGDLSSKACTSPLEDAYRKTYYSTWFRVADNNRNCLPCHAEGGEAGPSREFAGSDFAQSFQVFRTIGRSRVELNGLNAAHRPPHTGSQNTTYVDAAKNTWLQAEAAARACEGSTEVRSTELAVPANVFTTTPADNVTWPTITWDLDTDIVGAANTAHLTLKIEVSRFMQNGVGIGYRFRNPIVTVKTTGGATPTYRIKGLKMTRNGAEMTYMTGYELLDVTVNSTTGVNIAQGWGTVVAPTESGTVEATDKLGLIIGALTNADGSAVTPGGGGGGSGTGLPTRISFNELQSADPVKGVFARACNSCHNANQPSGGLNLTVYTAAQGRAANIQQRMNSVAAPMPPGGLLSVTDRAIVDIWLSSGTPQQ